MAAEGERRTDKKLKTQPQARVIDAFSPPAVPGQIAAFSPPPPDPTRPTKALPKRTVSTVKLRSAPMPKRTAAGCSKAATGAIIATIASRSAAPRPHKRRSVPASTPKTGIGREVTDDELFGTMSPVPNASSSSTKNSSRDAVSNPSPLARTHPRTCVPPLSTHPRSSAALCSRPRLTPARTTGVGREVENSELSGSHRASLPSVRPKREERGDELCGTAAASTRATSSHPAPRGVARREGLNTASSSSRTRAAASSSTSAPPAKRTRPSPAWEAARAQLATTGVKIVVRSAAAAAQEFTSKSLQTNQLRDVPDLSPKSFIELLGRVCAGRQHNLLRFPPEVVYKVLAHKNVTPDVLTRLEATHPILAPPIEAAWARYCTAEAREYPAPDELPAQFPSWRHFYEHTVAEKQRKLEKARTRIYQAYEESRAARAAVRVRVTTAAPPRIRRRRGSTEPLSALARLHQANIRSLDRAPSRR